MAGIRGKILPIIFSLGVILTGCGSKTIPLAEGNSNLTQGNVQLSVHVGTTTKAEILENFGAPNVTTRDSKGEEVWTYQRSGQISRSSTQVDYWTIFLAGQRRGTYGFESSSRMITLIIRFDNRDIVSDFNSRQSIF